MILNKDTITLIIDKFMFLDIISNKMEIYLNWMIQSVGSIAKRLDLDYESHLDTIFFDDTAKMWA